MVLTVIVTVVRHEIGHVLCFIVWAHYATELTTATWLILVRTVAFGSLDTADE